MREKLNIRVPIAIALGAIVGALCRYYMGEWLTQSLNTSFPIGTFFVNLSGCFLMGLITTFASRNVILRPELVLFLTTGVLGTYTTFSSYQLDAVMNVKNLQGDLLYLIGTPMLGLFSLEMGVKLAKLTQSSNVVK